MAYLYDYLGKIMHTPNAGSVLCRHYSRIVTLKMAEKFCTMHVLILTKNNGFSAAALHSGF